MQLATIYWILRALQVCLISQLVSVTILWFLNGYLLGRWGRQKNKSPGSRSGRQTCLFCLCPTPYIGNAQIAQLPNL